MSLLSDGLEVPIWEQSQLKCRCGHTKLEHTRNEEGLLVCTHAHIDPCVYAPAEAPSGVKIDVESKIGLPPNAKWIKPPEVTTPDELLKWLEDHEPALLGKIWEQGFSQGAQMARSVDAYVRALKLPTMTEVTVKPFVKTKVLVRPKELAKEFEHD